ncbi:hypothetical protein KI387_004333, partial [Taxus chinensis]
YSLEDETNSENEDSSKYPEVSQGDDQNVVEVEVVQGLQDLKQDDVKVVVTKKAEKGEP